MDHEGEGNDGPGSLISQRALVELVSSDDAIGTVRPEGSLDTRIGRELPYVRSYVLDGGRLVLNMMADSGSQVWRPSPE
jgi:hypothetical protein